MVLNDLVECVLLDFYFLSEYFGSYDEFVQIKGLMECKVGLNEILVKMYVESKV